MVSVRVGDEGRIIRILGYRSEENTRSEPQTHNADKNTEKRVSHTGHDEKVESQKERWGMQPKE